MDDEAKVLLKENIELSRENNTMLKRVIRAQKLAAIYRVVYWSIIILSTFGAYYFIQPYISNLLNVYTGGASGGNNFSDVFKTLSNKQQMQDLLDTIRN